MQIIEIKTRSNMSTYYARAIGHKIQVSSTAGIKQAVDTLKLKHFPHAVTLPLLPNSEQNRSRLAKSITHLLVIK